MTMTSAIKSLGCHPFVLTFLLLVVVPLQFFPTLILVLSALEVPPFSAHDQLAVSQALLLVSEFLILVFFSLLFFSGLPSSSSLLRLRV